MGNLLEKQVYKLFLLILASIMHTDIYMLYFHFYIYSLLLDMSCFLFFSLCCNVIIHCGKKYYPLHIFSFVSTSPQSYIIFATDHGSLHLFHAADTMGTVHESQKRQMTNMFLSADHWRPFSDLLAIILVCSRYCNILYASSTCSELCPQMHLLYNRVQKSQTSFKGIVHPNILLTLKPSLM